MDGAPAHRQEGQPAVALPDATPERETERLLRDGAGPVLRYLRSQVDTPTQAEELAQEALVRAFVALARGERPSRPEAWLIGIARYVLLETWRGERTRRRLRERQERHALVMGPGWEGAEGMDGVDRRVVVGEAVEGLPLELRVPVLLHYFGGLPVSEVAGHLETTTGAIKMRLLRARLTLRAQLEQLSGDVSHERVGKGAMTMASGTSKASGALTVRTASQPHQRRTAGRPHYQSVAVGLETGGLRGATDPLSVPVFSGGHLSLDDLRFATNRLKEVRLAGERPLCETLSFWNAPEPFHHPDPAGAWALLRQSQVLGTHAGDAAMPLVPTDGWRLGTDPEWRQILEQFQRAGLKHVWFTLLGLEEVHDELCERSGAFSAVVSAMERCAAVGLETGANVVVSTRNVHQLADLSRLARRLGAERYVPTYAAWWTPRGGRYEQIRPVPDDLAGTTFPPPELDANWGYKEFWRDLEAYTEAALVRRAIESTTLPDTPRPATSPEESQLSLVVDSNLDVHAGEWYGRLRRQVANLRAQSPQEVHRALAELPLPETPPSDLDLARRFGDPENRGLHTRPSSVRRKWLHAWQEARQNATTSGPT